MRPSRLLLLAAVVLPMGLFGVPPTQGQPNDDAVDAAKQAAAAWLDLVDAGAYETSWEEAVSLLKSQITADQWATRIQSVHDQLGAFDERSLIAARYTTSLPNVPEGEYVIAQYRAQYGDTTVVETATLMKEDEAWRIAGYFVRPENQ